MTFPPAGFPFHGLGWPGGFVGLVHSSICWGRYKAVKRLEKARAERAELEASIVREEVGVRSRSHASLCGLLCCRGEGCPILLTKF